MPYLIVFVPEMPTWSGEQTPDSHHLKKLDVLRTWSGILEREDLLPEDWIKWTGALVGTPTLDLDSARQASRDDG